MVTTLYLIRHGETEGSEVKRYKGSIDVPLSEEGIEQMKQVAVFIYETVTQRHGDAETVDLTVSPCRRVAVSSLSAVYSSPLSRALKSAEIIAEPHGLKPSVIPDLRERSFGVWEGMTFTEIKEEYPEEFESWATNPLKYSPIGGESTIEVAERVINALNMILENHKNNFPSAPISKPPPRPPLLKGGWGDSSGKNIAVVAHGGVNRIILCYIMRIPLENIFRIEQDFAAVNIIEFWDKYPVVKLINYRTQSTEDEGRRGNAVTQ